MSSALSVFSKPAVAAPYVVKGQSGGNAWAVFDADGTQVSEWTASEGSARGVCGAKIKAFHAAAGRRDRPCMHCRHVFPSEGIHNRLCDRCRRHPDTDMQPNSFARARRGA